MSDHAKQNAAAWAASIFGMIAARDAAHEADDLDAIDEAEREIDESALNVLVRDDWRTMDAFGKDSTPEEYQILLSAGGPALRIYGQVDDGGGALDARLEWQDWGTPWTEYYEATREQDAAILAFASQFIQAY